MYGSNKEEGLTLAQYLCRIDAGEHDFCLRDSVIGRESDHQGSALGNKYRCKT